MSNVSRSTLIESLSIDSPVLAADRMESAAPSHGGAVDSDWLKFWLGVAIFCGILAILAVLAVALGPGAPGDAVTFASR
jgi:hypothetical protein